MIALSMLMVAAAGCKGITDDPTLIIDPVGEPYVIPMSKSEQEINQSSNDFGLSLFRTLYSDGQVLVSPLSASLALSMTAYGARGNTEAQMLSTLGFSNHSRQEVGEFFKKMVTALSEADENTAFCTANSIWAQKELPIKNDFKEGVSKYYGADVKPADFSSSSIIKEINDWCSEKTDGLIKDAADNMDPSTIMSLVNALYFKGSWTKSFGTPYDGTFTAIGGSAANTRMMSLNDKLHYAADGNLMMVSIPYGKGSFMMDLIMPVKSGADAFADMVKDLDWTTYFNLISSMSPKNVALTMPVFKIEYDNDLKDALCTLGMTDAFGSDADFSGISDVALCISQVIHKTLIDVNDKGTEAAAVTVVTMRENASVPSETVYFTADRPFVFAIRERTSNALLFVGQKVN